MSGLILIIIMIFLAANGDYTLLWLSGGIVVLALLVSLFGKGDENNALHERPRIRIDIPHYYDADEYMCTICGHRFNRNVMSCPHCGVRFNRTRTDDRAYIEEEDEEDWLDEMEEEGW